MTRDTARRTAATLSAILSAAFCASSTTALDDAGVLRTAAAQVGPATTPGRRSPAGGSG